MPEITVRTADADDAPLLLRLIKGLAEYEKLTHLVSASQSDIAAAISGPDPAAEALIGSIDNQLAGFALYFRNFSTFLGKPGIYIEDIYVEPEHRKSGLGTALFNRIVALARERGCGRVEWAALDWNTPALDFYRKKGAEKLEEWVLHRLAGKALADFDTGEME